MHNKCNALESNPRNNCLPQNRSMMPKMLGTTDFTDKKIKTQKGEGRVAPKFWNQLAAASLTPHVMFFPFLLVSRPLSPQVRRGKSGKKGDMPKSHG